MYYLGRQNTYVFFFDSLLRSQNSQSLPTKRTLVCGFFYFTPVTDLKLYLFVRFVLLTTT